MSKKLPELLAPAGSPEALDAAIAAGADAVYFGTASFNARMGAKNFDGDTLRSAIEKCRSANVKTNITLNTLIHDREMYELLKRVEELYQLGADALIVADIGVASLIHEYFPSLELHASTQLAGHNTLAAKELSQLGFSRMVAARELSKEDLSTLCQNSPIETELFIHGAICVSQSGQCLASSMIGGRSGNRGECAQPCRLPWSAANGTIANGKKQSFALSLKDMCLAEHIPELLQLGAASFKIEGRMKSPDYVYGVVSTYRRLLDESRNATFEELDYLKRLFSRSGFTDGYFTKKISIKMLGIRTDADKDAAKTLTEQVNYKKLADERIARLAESQRIPVNMSAVIKAGLPSRLTAVIGETFVTVEGQIPERAINRPMTVEELSSRLSKLGGTGFVPGEISVELDEGLILPLSVINALRRGAVEALTARLSEATAPKVGNRAASPSKKLPKSLSKVEIPKLSQTVSARVNTTKQAEQLKKQDIIDFDVIYLPLESFEAGASNGVILPPVIFDSELSEVSEMLKAAIEGGASHALISNLGHLRLALDAGLIPHGDFRLNIYNSRSASLLARLGFVDLMASPELTLPQLRDLGLSAVIFGRVPLMVLEKCCICDLYSCEKCKASRNATNGFLPMIDRRQAEFIVTRAFKHRNILYNSLPIYMADRPHELEVIPGGHYIFTNEDITKVLTAYRDHLPTKSNVRRISK